MIGIEFLINDSGHKNTRSLDIIIKIHMTFRHQTFAILEFKLQNKGSYKVYRNNHKRVSFHIYRNTLTIFQDNTQHNLFPPAHITYTDILTAAPKKCYRLRNQNK